MEAVNGFFLAEVNRATEPVNLSWYANAQTTADEVVFHVTV